jgi:hypothetical protein
MTKPAKKTEPEGDETPFARFTRNMRALFAVPKKELDAKLAAQKHRTRRAKA